jgi:hypothetical protein
MPGIPTYENFKATPDLLPGARLHAPDSNVEASARGMRVLGKGLDDMGGALSKITLDLQDQANSARVTEALNTLKERQLYLTYDKDAGYKALKGKNALERPDKKSLDAEYTELLDTARVSLAAGLGNDRQRALFARESGSLMTSFRGNLVRHQAEEFRNYQITTHKGVIDVSGQEIALDPANEAAVRNALFRVAASVFEIGRLEGWPADKTETATRIAQSVAIKGATLALLDENDAGGAKAFFEAHKDSMTADDIHAIRRPLLIADESVQAQEATESLWARHKGNTTAARAEARAKYSGDEEDMIITRLNQRDSEQRTRRAEGKDWLLGQVQKFRDENPDQTFYDLPPTIQNALYSRGMADLAKKTLMNGFIDDSETWNRVINFSQAQWRNMSEVELKELQSGASPKHKEQMAALWRRAHDKEYDAQKVTDSRIDKMLQEVSRMSGILRKKPTEPAFIDFKAAFYDEFNGLTAAGKNPGMDEARRLAEGMAIKGKFGWFSPDARYYEEGRSGKKFVFDRNEIPPGIYKKITEDFKAANGRDPNRAEVIEAFQRVYLAGYKD